MGKPYIEVRLHSGLSKPLGGEDVIVYYECTPSVKKVMDSDIISYFDLLQEFVNTHDRFPKGEKPYGFSELNQLSVVYLDDDQIKRYQEIGYIIRKEDLINSK